MRNKIKKGSKKLPQPTPTPSFSNNVDARRCIKCGHELYAEIVGFIFKQKKYICKNEYCARYGLYTFVSDDWGNFSKFK